MKPNKKKYEKLNNKEKKYEIKNWNTQQKKMFLKIFGELIIVVVVVDDVI